MGAVPWHPQLCPPIGWRSEVPLGYRDNPVPGSPTRVPGDPMMLTVRVEGIWCRVQFPGSGPYEELEKVVTAGQARPGQGVTGLGHTCPWASPLTAERGMTTDHSKQCAAAQPALRYPGAGHTSAGALPGAWVFLGSRGCQVIFSSAHTRAEWPAGPADRWPGIPRLGGSGQPPPCYLEQAACSRPRSPAAHGDKGSPAASPPDKTQKPRTDTGKGLECPDAVFASQKTQATQEAQHRAGLGERAP